MDDATGNLIDEADQTTGSERLQYVDGLIDVYGDGTGGVLLAVRREPLGIQSVRSIEMTREQAGKIAIALLEAAGATAALISAGAHQGAATVDPLRRR